MPVPDFLLAYVGLGPGQELIPYFLALLAWVAGALAAIFQWPISALLRRLRGARGGLQQRPQNEPVTANLTESAGEGNQAQP